jgi:hypothetical protein
MKRRKQENYYEKDKKEKNEMKWILLRQKLEKYIFENENGNFIKLNLLLFSSFFSYCSSLHYSPLLPHLPFRLSSSSVVVNKATNILFSFQHSFNVRRIIMYITRRAEQRFLSVYSCLSLPMPHRLDVCFSFFLLLLFLGK